MGDKLEAALHGAEAPLHSPAGHETIAAELVACTLGERVRPELQPGYAALARGLQRLGKVLSAAFQRDRAAYMAGMRVAAQLQPPAKFSAFKGTDVS